MTDDAALKEKLAEQLLAMPSERLYRAAVVQLIGSAGEIACSFDRIAAALERIALVQEDEA